MPVSGVLGAHHHDLEFVGAGGAGHGVFFGHEAVGDEAGEVLVEGVHAARAAFLEGLFDFFGAFGVLDAFADGGGAEQDFEAEDAAAGGFGQQALADDADDAF